MPWAAERSDTGGEWPVSCQATDGSLALRTSDEAAVAMAAVTVTQC